MPPVPPDCRPHPPAAGPRTVVALEDGDDIAVGAALGVACGLVFWLFNFAYA